MGDTKSIEREFLDLICADEELLRAEFDAIVGSIADLAWDDPPPRRPSPPGRRPPPRRARRRPRRGRPVPVGGRREPEASARQRSPPKAEHTREHEEGR